jgi:predicted N-acetyltransferase YhbS
VQHDWELFLKHGPDDCRVAVDENEEVVGTVTTINYENHFTWIGMVLVDPANKRKGIGTQLLQEALQTVPENQTVKLDATPDGREVYLKLDFKDEYQLIRLHLDDVPVSKLQAFNARPMEENDVDILLKSDQKVFGADRRQVLEWIRKASPELAFVVEDENEIAGYCFGRRGHRYIQIGPVIAQHIDDARKVVSAAMQNCVGHEVILDVNQDESWRDWLFSLGFTEQRRLIRMFRGKNAWPGRPNKQYAILGPELG